MKCPGVQESARETTLTGVKNIVCFLDTGIDLVKWVTHTNISSRVTIGIMIIWLSIAGQ